MQDWLDKQMEMEGSSLEGIEVNLKNLFDAMMPQIRLAALENGDTAEVEIGVQIQFTENGTRVVARGGVLFPAKIFEAEFEA